MVQPLVGFRAVGEATQRRAQHDEPSAYGRGLIPCSGRHTLPPAALPRPDATDRLRQA